MATSNRKRSLEEDASSPAKAARTGDTVANVALVGGVLLTSTALVWPLADRPRKGALAPTVGPSFGGLSFTRSF